jgi:acyl-CoA thioesterase-2
MTDFDPTENLREVLRLTPMGEVRNGEEMFAGTVVPNPGKRVFGGQVIGQSIMAANLTLSDDRHIHSMHGYFLRAGDAMEPIEFGVENLRDGRSFSARRVNAYQNGRILLTMLASFQDWDQGLDHQDPMPGNLPDPESLPSTADILGNIDHPAARFSSTQRPFDVRHITEPLYLPGHDRPVSQDNAVWMKTFSALEGGEAVQRAALSYASDYTLLEPILRSHGLDWRTPGMSIASLDHAMWFHRPVRVDDWLLYIQHSPTATGARGLSIGSIYNRAGDLVASVGQEGMVRVPTELL